MVPSPAATPMQATAASTATIPTAVPTLSPVLDLPATLRIPSEYVVAHVEAVGLTDGYMASPSDPRDVGWLTDNPAPGEVGNAVIDGHLDTALSTAVFWRLGLLKPGDQVLVTTTRNRLLTFEVEAVRSYTLADAPLDQIFGPSGERRLNLITCAGAWDAAKHAYDERLVVYTHLVTAV